MRKGSTGPSRQFSSTSCAGPARAIAERRLPDRPGRDETRAAIHAVATADDLAATVALIRSYASSLDVDLTYQGFEAEMASMPGAYAPPFGALLLARSGVDGRPLGCIALRPLGIAGACEMKRLYVSPNARGLGLGARLVQAAVDEARRMGYREIRLDTLPTMTDAVALYARHCFERIAPYYDTPVAGTVFMARRIDPS